MSILKHLDKNNLHHAYLIEGVREDILPEIVSFLEEIGVKTIGNSDFVHIHIDSFKIDDARNLKAYGSQKSFSSGKKVFVISVNSFLLEAQNSLLKLFEEPIENTHFFLIVPDTNALLKTLVSRFFVIRSEVSPRQGLGEGVKEAEKFIAMTPTDRINFIKELLTEPEEEDDETIALDSTRARAIKFLNDLESVLHGKFVKNFSGSQAYFEHFFKVREFLRMPGSSAKSLMESVALLTPIF